MIYPNIKITKYALRKKASKSRVIGLLIEIGLWPLSYFKNQIEKKKKHKFVPPTLFFQKGRLFLGFLHSNEDKVAGDLIKGNYE